MLGTTAASRTVRFLIQEMTQKEITLDVSLGVQDFLKYIKTMRITN